jgi:hypothetical protein
MTTRTVGYDMMGFRCTNRGVQSMGWRFKLDAVPLFESSLFDLQSPFS